MVFTSAPKHQFELFGSQPEHARRPTLLKTCFRQPPSPPPRLSPTCFRRLRVFSQANRPPRRVSRCPPPVSPQPRLVARKQVRLHQPKMHLAACGLSGARLLRPRQTRCSSRGSVLIRAWSAGDGGSKSNRSESSAAIGAARARLRTGDRTLRRHVARSRAASACAGPLRERKHEPAVSAAHRTHPTRNRPSHPTEIYVCPLSLTPHCPFPLLPQRLVNVPCAPPCAPAGSYLWHVLTTGRDRRAMLATPSVKQRFNGGLSKHMAPPQVRPALRPALKPRSAFRRLAMPDLDHGRATATTSMLDPPHARPITTSMLDRHAVLAEHVASRQLDKLEVRGPASSGPKLCACGRCQGDGARDEAVSTGSPL